MNFTTNDRDVESVVNVACSTQGTAAVARLCSWSSTHH